MKIAYFQWDEAISPSHAVALVAVPNIKTHPSVSNAAVVIECANNTLHLDIINTINFLWKAICFSLYLRKLLFSII